MVTEGSSPAERRAVFLDRDGVLIRAVVRDGRPYPPATLADMEILPGVADTLLKLRAAGYLNIVVTNQPDVPRGVQKLEVMEAMHDRLRETLALDDIRTCLCEEGPDCPCYKPAPGMLVDAAREWGLDLKNSAIVGDRWRDVGAGQAAGCETFFVDCGYQEKQPDRPDHVVSDLREAGEILLDG